MGLINISKDPTVLKFSNSKIVILRNINNMTYLRISNLTDCFPEWSLSYDNAEKTGRRTAMIAYSGAALPTVPGNVGNVTDNKRLGDKYKGNYADFLDALGFKESTDRYNITSASGTYMGRYQMGPDALKSAGFMDGNGNWTDLAKKYGVTSKQTFLNSRSAQEYAIRVYHKWMLDGITNNEIDKLYNTTFSGTVEGTNRKESALLTPSGILASMHLVGRGSTIRMLVGNRGVKGIIKVDGNGTTATEYMNSFGGYDLKDLYDWKP